MYVCVCPMDISNFSNNCSLTHTEAQSVYTHVPTHTHIRTYWLHIGSLSNFTTYNVLWVKLLEKAKDREMWNFLCSSRKLLLHSKIFIIIDTGVQLHRIYYSETTVGWKSISIKDVYCITIWIWKLVATLRFIKRKWFKKCKHLHNRILHDLKR